MKTSKIIFDIECDSLKPTKIHCIVAKELGGSIHKFTPTKIDEGIKFLENADVLVGHNILSYDIPVIKKLTGVDLSNKDIEDTLVMSRLFYPIRENGHSLKTWGYRVNFVKQEQPLDFEVYTPQMLEYCVNDVMLNELVYLQLAKEGKGFDEKSIELEHQVAKVIADQEANGFKFDEKQATMLLAELKTKMNEVTDEVQQTFKPRMVDIKLVTPKFKKDGELSKSGLRPEEYNRLIESGDYSPFMRQELQEFNLGSRKQIGEYLIEFGRMSHSHPNVAQVPAVYSPFGKECRSCWTVDEGNVLLGVDASGLELRMLAHYMDDKDYINEVINGDIHTTNQNLAGIESRDKAKTFIYALVYGAGNAKIGQVVGGNRTAGKQLRDRFLTNLPSLKKLTDRVQQASRRGFLKGLDGRKIYVRSEHAALNTLLQGGGAIVMKKGLVLLDQILKLNAVDYKFVANIHDEWQIEVKENQADFVGNLAVENLIKAGEYFNLRCPLDGEYKIGRSWYDTH
jgi:DNA polymerase-1